MELLENGIAAGDTDKLLCLSLDIGEAMLKNGGEIHRVEDTVGRLCRAYGAVHTEIYAIPSLIIAAIRMPDGSYSSQIRRVMERGYNMYNVELFNDISRKACTTLPTLDELDKMIKEAKLKRAYPFLVIMLGAMITTGGFAIFFGGSIRDGIAAALIGAIICLGEKLPQKNINSFVKTALQSFFAGTLGYLFVLMGLGQSIAEIMMGTIMYSIPGLALGIAAKDMLYGDFHAGSMKLMEACITALMIAFGYVLSMLLFRGVM